MISKWQSKKARLVCAWAPQSSARGQSLSRRGAETRSNEVRFLDQTCAGFLFLLSIADCLLVPRTYTGRIWIFGTALALLFTAMLNILRLRNGRGVKGLRMFCITGNVSMFAFAVALMASIGKLRALQNRQIPMLAGL